MQKKVLVGNIVLCALAVASVSFLLLTTGQVTVGEGYIYITNVSYTSPLSPWSFSFFNVTVGDENTLQHLDNITLTINATTIGSQEVITGAESREVLNGTAEIVPFDNNVVLEEDNNTDWIMPFTSYNTTNYVVKVVDSKTHGTGSVYVVGNDSISASDDVYLVANFSFSSQNDGYLELFFNVTFDISCNWTSEVEFHALYINTTSGATEYGHVKAYSVIEASTTGADVSGTYSFINTESGAKALVWFNIPYISGYDNVSIYLDYVNFTTIVSDMVIELNYTLSAPYRHVVNSAGRFRIAFLPAVDNQIDFTVNIYTWNESISDYQLVWSVSQFTNNDYIDICMPSKFLRVKVTMRGIEAHGGFDVIGAIYQYDGGPDMYYQFVWNSSGFFRVFPENYTWGDYLGPSIAPSDLTVENGTFCFNVRLSKIARATNWTVIFDVYGGTRHAQWTGTLEVLEYIEMNVTDSFIWQSANEWDYDLPIINPPDGIYLSVTGNVNITILIRRENWSDYEGHFNITLFNGSGREVTHNDTVLFTFRYPIGEIVYEKTFQLYLDVLGVPPGTYTVEIVLTALKSESVSGVVGP